MVVQRRRVHAPEHFRQTILFPQPAEISDIIMYNHRKGIVVAPSAHLSTNERDIRYRLPAFYRQPYL